jgi:cell division protein FtsZ
MVFVTAGMGGGTGTGAAPVIARAAQEAGILTVGVVTKPFHFEGQRRMRVADGGITELQKCVDTLLIIPNQNLFRVANEKTTFADAFAMADQVLYSGVACITDLMVKEGLINLDFADVRAVMREMGKAMMGTGEAEGEKRAMTAAEAAISNPLIDDASMKGAKGLLISISGGRDLTLYEVDEAATRIREEVDQDANIIVGATFDEGLEGIIRVSVVATGIDHALAQRPPAAAAAEARIAEVAQRLRADNEKLAQRAVERAESPRPVVATQAAPPPAAPPATLNESIESAKAAVAAAILPQNIGSDVTIRPLGPKPSLFIDPAVSGPEPHEPETFIPPQPERMPTRNMRMPRIDELPVPAQNEIRARRGELVEEHPEKRRTSLLQRLAAVGLGRREQDDEEVSPAMPQRPAAPLPPMPQSPPERLSGRPVPRQEPRPEPVSEYAKRSAPQGLDQHGRQAPVHNRSEDDQLDIPAFLRRQAK